MLFSRSRALSFLCKRAHTHTHAGARALTHKHTYAHTCTHLHTHAHAHTRMHTHSEDFQQAEREGFMRLFSYISGANEEGIKVPMTAPVLNRITPGQVHIEKQRPGQRQINRRLSLSPSLVLHPIKLHIKHTHTNTHTRTHTHTHVQGPFCKSNLTLSFYVPRAFQAKVLFFGL